MVDQSKSLRESLVKSGLISEPVVKEALEEGRRRGESLIKSILRKGAIEENSLIAFLEKEMEIPRVDLSSYLIDQKTINLVPLQTARKFDLIPLFRVGDVLTVAMVDPFDVVALDEVRNSCGCDVEPMVATLREIDQAIIQYYGVSGSVEELIKDIGPSRGETSEKIVSSLEEEAPVIKLVNLLIAKAVNERASDIHIDPTEKNVRIRYRVDGIMHDVSTAPTYLLSSIITRIKVMSKMDIAESRVPQDGRFELKVEGKTIDARVSSYPTIYGEALVMRLLDKGSVHFSLKDLGFSDDNYKLFEEMIKRPYGIILVTGPTGSGKTTTLYTTLNHIVSPEKNIMTIEDPVEYELAGVRQAQTNPKAGLDFANALRAMLRQDPDVILVGEIRDEETARVAIQSALTGHLVFSTLHTNDAPGTLTRLTEMGIEPFLIASSVIAAIAQRLVRRICPKCGGKGCSNCLKTGYLGRAALYEILVVDTVIKDLVIKKASTEEIRKAAIKAGMRTLRDDGLLKVKQGVTTMEEVLRVTALD